MELYITEAFFERKHKVCSKTWILLNLSFAWVLLKLYEYASKLSQ